MRKILSTVLFGAITLAATAQSGTNSPYSQYGLGVLADQTSGFNRGMSGLSMGFRDGNQVNFMNPASYSAMDSLTFIFDVGMFGQVTNFKEGNKKKNAYNADFDYAVAGFRVARHTGVSFGIIPFTNVGYNFSATNYLNDEKTSAYTNTYTGTGGLHQAYLGIGWEPVRHLSVGGNVSFLWGNYERTITNAYSESSVNTLTKKYSASVSNYKLDLGLQYVLPLSKKDFLTVGASYSPGHKLHSDPECVVISNSSLSSDTTTYTVSNGLEIPNTFGAGFMYNHANKLRLGADYQLQQWGSVGFPRYLVSNDVPSYSVDNNYYLDRHKVTLGGEFCKDRTRRGFLNQLRCRAGVSYATPYLRVNGQDGPKELSVSMGFGIPIINNYNNRSLLNISGQWVHQSGKGMITENTFRINVGITFNERWFWKWKVE